MEFQMLFPILRNRLSDGYDVPMYCRELFAQITEVTEEEWGTPKDPESKITKESTLRAFAKRGLSGKFSQSIVYRLTPDNLVTCINKRPVTTRQLLADDLVAYVPEITADTVGTVIADMLVDIIRRSAGLVPQDKLEQEKQRKLFAELKVKFGEYLYDECDGSCPFPGCGKKLSVVMESKIMRVYEVSLIDKKKKATADNLIALCPTCHATYQMDNSKTRVKELAGNKALLSAHEQSVRLLDNIALEKGIVGVIRKIVGLQEKELFGAELDPKELTQKIKPADNFILYATVKNYVTAYFLKIREIMTNFDKRGTIDYDVIQDQMKAIYKRLKKANKSQAEIFSEITEKFIVPAFRMIFTVRLLSATSFKAVRYSMQLPNKLYSYKDSTLALIPIVLNALKDGPISASTLFHAVRYQLNDATDFLSVMDCLYALRAIDMNDEGEVFICSSN